MPFYKRDSEALLSSDSISGPGYSLTPETQSDYVYPVDGWLWFATLAEALTGMSAPVSAASHITTLAFDNRFTDAELVALELTALDNPSSGAATRQLAASLRVNQRKVTRANFIDLQRTDTRAGVIQLETAGLLGVGRALQILDAPIQTQERPK